MDAIPQPPDLFVAIEAAKPLTLADLGPLLLMLFFLPGDWLIWAALTHAPAVARFLELAPQSYGGLLSGFVSACAWIALLIGTSMTYTAIRDFDEALTRRIVNLYQDACRRARIAAALTAYRWRRLRGSLEARQTPQLSEELVLTDEEIRVLRAHAKVGPGYALAVGELAAALGARTYEVQRTLERLTRLNLLRSTIGGLDGQNAYHLTPAGRAFLVFRQMAPKDA
ncbi:MAG TPA: hypothetical protein VF329_01665 [Gammaproteobacteria bacterium]